MWESVAGLDKGKSRYVQLLITSLVTFPLQNVDASYWRKCETQVLWQMLNHPSTTFTGGKGGGGVGETQKDEKASSLGSFTPPRNDFTSSVACVENGPADKREVEEGDGDMVACC